MFKNFKLSSNLVELTVTMLILSGVGYTLFATWQVLQTKAADPVIVSPSKSGQPIVSGIPKLVLNVAHQRSGDTVEVVPGKIGKANPFLP